MSAVRRFTGPILAGLLGIMLISAGVQVYWMTNWPGVIVAFLPILLGSIALSVGVFWAININGAGK